MGAFLQELGAEFKSPIPWVVFLTVAMVVSVAGPFGSYGALGISDRVLVWAPISFLAVLIGSFTRACVHGPIGIRHRLLAPFLITAANSVVLGPTLYLLLHGLFSQVFRATSSLQEISFLVASLSLGICALRATVETPVAEFAPPSGSDHHPPVPRLARRLDLALRGDIWAISVRDHYVDVHTSLGKASLLMRFSDAIDEVDCVEGSQVHRSHWVAWSGVDAVCREGGKMILNLKSGQQIPVSRNNRDKVEARFPISAPAGQTEAQGAA